MKEGRTIGISGYEIKQEVDGKGQMTIHLTFMNIGGDCGTYDRFLQKLEQLLKQEST